MTRRHYHEPFDNGGALIRPQRTTRGVYELPDEMKARAREFVREHADYYRITGPEMIDLLEMLGIVDDQTPEETP